MDLNKEKERSEKSKIYVSGNPPNKWYLRLKVLIVPTLN